MATTDSFYPVVFHDITQYALLSFEEVIAHLRIEMNSPWIRSAYDPGIPI